MPQFITEIPNCEETISSPIVVSAISRIIRTYKWYRDFDFKYSTFGDSVLVKGSEIDLPTMDRSQQRLTTDQTVQVEVSERYNEEAVRASHGGQGTQKNIFECHRTKTTLHPLYQQMIAEISMKFRFRTRHAAENFRKRVQLATTKSVDGMRLEVKYTYTIPYAFLDVLKRIYDLMESRHGYGISLGQWLRESFTDNLTTLANQSGEKSVLAIAEVNQNVLVLVNSPDEVQAKEKESDEDSWSVTMDFNIYYDRPDGMRMRFQHLINNQFIGLDIANRFKVLKQDYLKARTHMAQLNALKAGDIPVGKNPLSGATSPLFDDWLPPAFNKNYPDVLRAMVMLDETDYHNVIDLNDIADFELTEPVKRWLTRTHNTVLEFGKNVFWLRVWAWDQYGTYNTYQLSEDLKLTSELPLNPRINYHVTLGITINADLLDPSTWNLLGEDREVLEEWLSLAIPKVRDRINGMLKDYHDQYRDTDQHGWFEDHPYDPNLETRIPKAVLEKIKKLVTNLGPDTFKTVMLHGVLVKKKGVNYA